MDIQSTVTSTVVDQTTADFDRSMYTAWNTPNCRYADCLYAENSSSVEV